MMVNCKCSKVGPLKKIPHTFSALYGVCVKAGATCTLPAETSLLSLALYPHIMHMNLLLHKSVVRIINFVG